MCFVGAMTDIHPLRLGIHAATATLCLALGSVHSHAFEQAAGAFGVRQVINFPLTDENEEKLADGEVVVNLSTGEAGSIKTTKISAAIDIPAAPATIWAAMTDCDAALDIVPHLSSCTILDRGTFSEPTHNTAPAKSMWDVRRHVVRYSRLFPKTINEFRSTYDRPRAISFEKSGGDLKVLSGQWVLAPQKGTPGDTPVTRVYYQAELAIGQPVPRFILKRVTHGDTKTILRNLRMLSVHQHKERKRSSAKRHAVATPR
ncbi:MAG: SRPBCC family protein [Pseudomonadota bacterium]